MPIRTADDAHAEIGHHFAAISGFMDQAHLRFQQECRAIAHVIDPRTRASIYRDLIVRNARDYCDDGDNKRNGAHFYRKGQLCLMGLESKYVVRVKRLSAGFSVGVSPTIASKEYDGNVMPAYASSLFTDMSEPTLLYLGWFVAENAPDKIQKFLVCNDERREVA